MSRFRRALPLVAVAVLAALLGGVGGAYASHQFSDVPDWNFFHDDVEAITGAGCASGFNDGTFRTGAPTTRGQFARWMHNCAGRVAYREAEGQAPTIAEGPELVLGQSLRAGALDNPAFPTGAFVVVNVDYDVAQFAPTAGCEVAFILKEDNTTTLDTTIVELPPDNAGLFEEGTGGATTVRLVEGGAEVGYSVEVVENAECGTGTPDFDIDLTAMTFPFDGNGRPALEEG